MIPRGRPGAFWWLLCWAIAWCGSPGARADGVPEIFGLSPDEGPAGTRILISGRHLWTTRDVVFSAGWSVRRAKFKVVSDRELEVIAPEFLREGTPATVAIIADRGATVGMPPDVLTVDRESRGLRVQAAFYHVEEGGDVPSAAGISLIEAGGVVQQSHAVGMQFVRRGGVLLAFSNGGGVVFHERGAILGPRFQTPGSEESRVRLVSVREIRPSLGVAPFIFRAPEPLPGAASRPPRIVGIRPLFGIYGETITVSGAGFTGTTAVYFSNGLHGSLTPAGFQVVSDQTMKVQVPDAGGAPRPKLPRYPMDSRGRVVTAPRVRIRPQFLIVVNPKGATVTVPADRSGRPVPEVYDLFQYVRPGAQSTRVNGVYYVASGGVASHSAALAFLKKGSQLATSNVADVFCEPDAIVPDRLDRGRNVHRVELIQPSPLPQPFTSFIP